MLEEEITFADSKEHRIKIGAEKARQGKARLQNVVDGIQKR